MQMLCLYRWSIICFCFVVVFSYLYAHVCSCENEPRYVRTSKMAHAPSEDSDQPRHPPSLIRVFAVCMKKAWVLSYPLSAQRRLWSDWANVQADLSLRWAHMPLWWFCHDAAQMKTHTILLCLRFLINSFTPEQLCHVFHLLLLCLFYQNLTEGHNKQHFNWAPSCLCYMRTTKAQISARVVNRLLRENLKTIPKNLTKIKFKIWSVTFFFFFFNFFTIKKFGIYFRFSCKRRFTTCTLRWDRV